MGTVRVIANTHVDGLIPGESAEMDEERANVLASQLHVLIDNTSPRSTGGSAPVRPHHHTPIDEALRRVPTASSVITEDDIAEGIENDPTPAPVKKKPAKKAPAKKAAAKKAPAKKAPAKKSSAKKAKD